MGFIHSLKKYLSSVSHELDIVSELKMQEDGKGSYPSGCFVLMKTHRKQANKERKKNAKIKEYDMHSENN